MLAVCQRAQQKLSVGIERLAVGYDGAAVIHAFYKRGDNSLGVGVLAAVAGLVAFLVYRYRNGGIKAEVDHVVAVSVANLEQIKLSRGRGCDKLRDIQKQLRSAERLDGIRCRCRTDSSLR